MACAKPVVASAVGGLAEIIAPGRNGVLTPPGEPEALAEALIDLLQDRARQHALGWQARMDIVETVACPRIAAATVDIYRQAETAQRRLSLAADL
jgi:glycosyltransferase involved in cell wall biosynthesis